MREVRKSKSGSPKSNKNAPDYGSGATKQDLTNGYCFVCGLALVAGDSFEPLWDPADMYIFLCGWLFAAMCIFL